MAQWKGHLQDESGAGAGPAPGYRDHPEHKVIITPHDRVIRVMVGERVVADSADTLLVQESGHDPVIYFPRNDVAMDLLVPSSTHSHCPFKGEARYWSIAVEGRTVQDAAWSYEQPYDEALRLRKYIAFYADKVDRIEDDPAINPTAPVNDGGAPSPEAKPGA